MSLQNKLLQNFEVYRNKLAICHQGQKITYGDLAGNALKVAAFLNAQDETAQCIGIQTDAPVQHIYALVGILLSRNYYLSITRENSYFLSEQDQLSIRHVLFSGTTPPAEKLDGATYHSLDDILSSSLPDPNVISQSTFDDTAYCSVFSTSGSTGIPKLVVHSIRHIWSDSQRQIQENEIGENDRIDLLFSFTFSASLACIFPALLSGGAVCIYDLKKNGIARIPVFWKENSITFSTISVSSFRAICQLHPNLKYLEQMRFVCIGAEPVTFEDIDLFRRTFSDRAVLQVAYATTEVRTISEYKFSNQLKEAPAYITSVGQVVQGKRVEIRSESGELLPVGSSGEIVVKTDCIARSINGATSKPIDEENGVFKTGDLGYFDADGYLHYVSRKHQEVKVNGVKINLYSIEKEAEKHLSIDKAVALVTTTKSQRRNIVLCIEAKSEIDRAAIRDKLSQKLPISHLPHFFFQIEQFPLTHTGKTDRKALAAMVQEQNWSQQEESGKQSKLTPTQQEIIRIWNEVLKTNQTGLDTDFFNDLGGDSLSAMLCIGEIERSLQVKIPNYAIASCRTPFYLSKYIKYRLYDEVIAVSRINLPETNRKNIYFLDLYTNYSFRNFLTPELSEQFNLSYIHYDIYNHAYEEDITEKILGSMQEIVCEDKEIILVGYCFSAYMAFQLATRLSNVSSVVMLDPPNYFEYRGYENSGRFSAIKTLLYRIIGEKDFSYPIYLLNRQLKNLLSTRSTANGTTKDHSTLDANYIQAINHILDHTATATIQTNCLFIKSTRSYLRNIDHGYNWAKYIAGNFKMVTLHSNHEDLIKKKQAVKTTEQLLLLG